MKIKEAWNVCKKRKKKRSETKYPKNIKILQEKRDKNRTHTSLIITQNKTNETGDKKYNENNKKKILAEINVLK